MEDQGHLDLIKDIAELLKEVEAFEFHDFKNEKYAAPKMELVMKLGAIMDSAKNGKYDN